MLVCLHLPLYVREEMLTPQSQIKFTWLEYDVNDYANRTGRNTDNILFTRLLYNTLNVSHGIE